MSKEPIFRLPEPIARLNELAYNLQFSWNDDAEKLFQSINPSKWSSTSHNPVHLLQETDAETFEGLSQNPQFLEAYNKVISQWDAYRERSTWFQQHFPEHADKKIAYFSAEFGFHESLPIYSGGLGVLAGDHCKSASDLGLPLVGIGLLYKKGYFVQKFDQYGNQIAEQVVYDFSKLPIQPTVHNGKELIVNVILAGRTVYLKVWTVLVGTVTVYLLDADIEQNTPQDRGLTGQLYGGNQDTRIQQEILLGIGGIQALRALGIYPHVYHINEGHAAFLTLERIREHIYAGLPFPEALEQVRASTIFTTHTPVPAGHDAFPLGMFEYYLQPLLGALPNERQDIINLGLDRGKHLFNMTFLALNTATLRGGVSKLHGEVSREMFRDFHGNLPVHEVPIGHVTNGVHLGTWLAYELEELYSRFLPDTWKEQQDDKAQWAPLSAIPAEAVWKVHTDLKARLIDFARNNLKEQRLRNGESQARIDEVDHYLNPNVLTIGFARRFATYKRSTLIFSDLDRLDRLVNDPKRPVQLIFAGKAHPADHPGQELIREIYRISQLERFRGKIVLLENYDMNVARHLVQGVDVWLNNPRRPHEASGTSGQKAALNGVLNFSILDGWWVEGYDGKNGWSITANDKADWNTQEHENVESLYRTLEREIVPLYYDDGELPAQWVEKMKYSVITLTPEYNTNRMVQEYTTRFYAPTIARAQKFSENNYAEAGRLSAFKRFIRENWHQVKFTGLEDPEPTVSAQESLAKKLFKPVRVTLDLGRISPQDVVVEAVYYEEKNGYWDPVPVPFQPDGEPKGHISAYTAKLPAHLKHGPHFSIRVRPYSPDFAHGFELTEITTL